MAKILVTGATGFIGDYVVGELLQKGYEVIATSLSREKAVTKEWFHRVDYRPADLNGFNSNWFGFFDEPDCMLHLAWEGLPNYKDSFHYERNLPNNFSFIKNMINGGLKSLTVTGTCFEYGLQEGCLSEEMPVNPVTAYGIAKDSLRRMLENYLSNRNDIYFNWVRLFYMYGKGQGKNSLLSQLHTAIENKQDVFNMSGGEQLRDYLSVEEVAQNLVTVAGSNYSNGIVNCCSGQPISIRKFVEDEIERLESGIKLNLSFYSYPDYESFAFWGDNRKLQKLQRNY